MGAASLWIAAGCVHRPAVVTHPAAFDYSKVRQIAVAPFEGPGGQAASDEFVRQVLGTGMGVTDASHAHGLILRGVVTEYKSNNQLMVFLGGDNPVLTPSTQVTPEEMAAGAHKVQVASVVASVGIQARLMDLATKRTIWSDSYVYEGLDLPTALTAVVNMLKHSMAHVLPQMNSPKAS